MHAHVYIRMYVWFSLYRPSTTESLKAIEGVSENWLKLYGRHFLKQITEFCTDSGNVAMDVPPMITRPAEEKLVRVYILTCISGIHL